MQPFNRPIAINKSEIPVFPIVAYNFYSLFGFAFFLLGTVFCIVFSFTIKKATFYSFSYNVETVKGEILRIDRTSFGYGDDSGNEHEPIYEYTFRYIVNNKVYTNKGYGTGLYFKVKDSVFVDYKKNKPAISKAEGLTTSHYGLWILIMLLFPLAGLWFIRKGVKWGNNFIETLKNGVITYGYFQRVNSTSDDYEYHYSFTDFNGSTRHVSEVRSDKEVVPQVKIIYNKDDHDKAFVLNWKSLPLIFGKSKVQSLLNDA